MKVTAPAAFLIMLIVSIPVAFAETIALTYDANGNLITGDGKFRVYNDLNQLVEVRNGTNSTAPLLETYVYHPVEERILFKDVYSNGNVSETVYYVNENFVQVSNSSGNFSTTYVKQDGVLVAQKQTITEYLHPDHLGSSDLITDELGLVVENTTYEPFGAIVAGGTRTRFDYEGKEYGDVVGDYDFNFRKYDPHLKLFVRPDVLINDQFNPQSLNRYSFELNNPYKYVDPTGLWAVQTGLSLSGGLGIFGPLAGLIESGPALAYDEESGMLEFGWYSSVGPGAYLGAPGLSASGAASYTPNGHFVKDIRDYSVSSGIEVPVGTSGVVLGGGASYPLNAKGGVDTSNPTYGGSLGGGFKASAYTYGTTTNTVTIASIKISNQKNTQQVANANTASQSSQKTQSGNTVMTGLTSTLKSIGKQVVQSVTQIANKIVNFLKSFFSPKKKGGK